MTNQLRFREEPYAFTYGKRGYRNGLIRSELELELELEDFEFEQSIKSTPALLGKLEKSSHGETIYVKIGIGNGLPASTGIYIPNHFKPYSEIAVLIYLHGHKTYYPGNNVLINGYWDGTRFPFFALREELAASGKNMILVAPSLGSKSQAGTLVNRGGFDAYLKQVLSALNAHYMALRHGYRISGVQSIILAAHSGGGSPMWKIAAGKEQYSAKIKECWSFDGMYGRVANAWTAWAKGHPKQNLYVYYGPSKGYINKAGRYVSSPRENAESIACEVKKQGLINVCIQPSRARTVGKIHAHFWVPQVHIRERLLNRPCSISDICPHKPTRITSAIASNKPLSIDRSVNSFLLQQIQNAFAGRQWNLGLGLARSAGIGDENKLTSLILFARHPERRGRKLEKNERDFKKLSQEWLDIRDKIVRPYLAKNTALKSSDGQLKEISSPNSFVTFSSGESLSIVKGPMEPGEEHYDPNKSGNPLLDTSGPNRSKPLSKNFTVKEFARSGSKQFDIARIDPKLVYCLQAMRDQVGKPIRVSSGYRSYGYNKKIYQNRKKKPTDSQHTSGRAVDIKIDGMTGLEIAKLAIDTCGCNLGVGLGKNFAHIDVRGKWAKWTYITDKTDAASVLREIENYRNSRCKGTGQLTPSASTGSTRLNGTSQTPGLSDQGKDLLVIQSAIKSGTKDVNTLTNMVFFTRHPERGGRKLEKNERDFKKLSQEWLDIRNKKVRPFLAKNTPVAPSGTQPPIPVPGDKPFPDVNVSIPQSGPGYYSYTNTNPNHRYGRVETIEALKAIALGWHMAYPRGPQIGIGDISLLGGGPTPRHKSHQTGLDVDLRLMRNDGRKAGARYQDPFYSRVLTQDLVNRIIKNGILKVQYIFFNDPNVTSVRFSKGHDNHLHVRFYPPKDG